MSFKIVILIFIVIILSNKILDKLIILSEQKKREKKEIFHINILKDFENLVIKYLQNKGYTNMMEGQFGEITIYSEEGAILVKYIKMNKSEDIISKEEIITFIANMNMKGFKKGIFLTNAEINCNIKDIIKNEFHNHIDLEIVCGINFTIELKKIKVQEKNILYI